MSTLVDISINSVTLAFADRALEQEFQTDNQAQSLTPVRVSLATGLVLIGLLGLLDWAFFPDSYRAIWIFRYALVCPSFGAMLLLSFAPLFRRFQRVILWVGAGSAGLGLILIVVAARKALIPNGFSAPSTAIGVYVGCLCLHLIFSCQFLRLPFLAAAGLCGAVEAVYGLMVMTATDASVWLGDGELLVASAAVGLAAAYILERARRADFLWRRKFHNKTDEMDRAREEMEALTRVDALTGLASRRHFFETAERDLERCRRYSHPLAIIMLDLDHFKVVNDTCGHVTGDRVLEAVAGQIRYNVREADTAGRYGGEEFVVVLPETGREAALQVGERLRSYVESLRIDAAIGRLSVTVSVGIAASADSETATLDDLLNRADKALLAAKQAGRNRVNVWSAQTDEVQIDRSKGR